MTSNIEKAIDGIRAYISARDSITGDAQRHIVIMRGVPLKMGDIRTLIDYVVAMQIATKELLDDPSYCEKLAKVRVKETPETIAANMTNIEKS